MTDLIRLMFDDGATRPAAPVREYESFYFTYRGLEYCGTIFRTPEDLNQLFAEHSGRSWRGNYFYSETAEIYDRSGHWSLTKFLADPTREAPRIWDTLAPGWPADPHPNLLEDRAVVFVKLDAVQS